jgi:FG-GAP repeat
MEMRRMVVVMALARLLTWLMTVPPAAGATVPERAAEAARIDFNGDGFDDLAVGAPGEAIGSLSGAGAVNVLYGSAAGLVPSAIVFTQGSGGLGGVAEAFDLFGFALE